MFALVPSSEEYKSALVNFPLHGNYEVIEVQCIVNQSLYGRYVSLQEEFYRSSPRRGTETLLFFGTDTQTYPKINAHGFHTDFQRSFGGMCNSLKCALIIIFILIQLIAKDSSSSQVQHVQLHYRHVMLVASIMFTMLVF